MVLEVAVLFMYARYVFGLEPSKNTLNAVADDLRDWWTYLEFFEISWLDATADNLVGYTDAMKCSISPKTGSVLASTTITRRRSTIKSLYEWASAEPWLTKRVTNPYSLGAPGIVKAQRAKSEPSEHNPQVLTPEDARIIMGEVGLLPSELDTSEQDADQTSRTSKRSSELQACTHRLGCQLALEVGFRVAEVVTVPFSAFSAYKICDDITDTRGYEISILGKGKRVRRVAISGSMLKEILIYRDVIRPSILRSASNNSKMLLVHSSKSGRKWWGKSLSTRSLQRSFVAAAEKCGCVTLNLATKIEAGKVISEEMRKKNLYTFHDLRHTYAVWTYYFLLQNGEKDPWMLTSTQN